MTNRHCFEALDRNLKDVMKIDKPLGGLIIIFGGDFGQALPIVPKGSRHDIANASLSSSKL